MSYREPDILFSVKVTDWGGHDFRERIGNEIDRYFSQHGVQLSELGVRNGLTTQGGGEATYHVAGRTVLVRTRPDTPYSYPKSYGLGIFVEGPDKQTLVNQIEAQLAEFKIPAKA